MIRWDFFMVSRDLSSLIAVATARESGFIGAAEPLFAAVEETSN